MPGNKAAQCRFKAADIITRYYAGDISLVDEIRANHTAPPAKQ
jgi:hypothetical protein